MIDKEEIAQEISAKHMSDRTWLSKDITDTIREAEARGRRAGIESAMEVATTPLATLTWENAHYNPTYKIVMEHLKTVQEAIRALMEETK